MGKTVVIAGAGGGGLATAVRLVELLGQHPHQVIVIDQATHHSFWASFPWLVVGKRSAPRISRPLSRLEQHGVTFIRQRIQRISLEQQRIITSGGSIAYDYLVMGLGVRYDYDRIPGYRQHAYGFYELSAALRLRQVLSSFPGGVITLFITSLPFKCEAAPAEMILLLDDYFRQKSLGRTVQLQLVTPESRLLSSLQPAIGEELARLLHQRGIGLRTSSTVAEVGPDYLQLTSGERLPTDLAIGVPPHTGQVAERTGGLGDVGGRIEVDGRTLATRQPGVWAVGDLAKIPLPVGPGHTPMSGGLAKLEGNVVADQLRATLTGRRPTGYFKARGACALLSSSRQGVHITTDFNTPLPGVIYSPSRLWFLEKWAIEQWWLHRWF